MLALDSSYLRPKNFAPQTMSPKINDTPPPPPPPPLPPTVEIASFQLTYAAIKHKKIINNTKNFLSIGRSILSQESTLTKAFNSPALRTPAK